MLANEIVLQNARLLYNRIYTPDDNGKCNVTLIIDDDVSAVYGEDNTRSSALQALKRVMTEVANEQNPVKDKEGKGKIPPPERQFMRAGEHCEPDDIFFKGNWRVRANTRKDEKPFVLDGHGKVTKDQIRFYMGCRVNCKIRVGFMEKFTPKGVDDNGKPHNEVPSRLTAQFISIQFAADDETLDPRAVSAEDAQEGFGATGYTPSSSMADEEESYDNEAFG